VVPPAGLTGGDDDLQLVPGAALLSADDEGRVRLHSLRHTHRPCTYDWLTDPMCPKWDSNPHTVRYPILSRARLPIPPFGPGGTGSLYPVSAGVSERAVCTRCAA